MKHFYFFLFIFLVFLLSGCQKKEFKSNDHSKSADSVSYFYEKAKETDSLPQKISFYNKALARIQQNSDTLHSLLLDHKIYYHNRLKEYDSSLFFADSLRRVATIQNDTSRVALAFYRKAVINRYLDNQPAVFKNAFESRQRYLQLGDSTKAARRSLEMAIAQSRMNDYTGSQESATEALRFLDPDKDREYFSSAFNVIAIAYREQGFYNDALKEYENALRHAENLEDSLTYQNNIALVYSDQKEYEKSIAIFEDISEKVPKDNYSSRARYLGNLAFSRWQQNPEIDISSELLQILELRKEHNDHSGLLGSYEHLSRFYANRDNAKALDYTERWLEAAKENNSLNTQVAALKQLVYLNSGNEVYVKNYMDLNDSLAAVNLQAKNTFAKIRFDEERKQQEISQLQASAARQALENQQIKTRNYLLAFFAVLVLGIAIFITYYNRQKHKREKIKEIHNTEARISKVIHDELANDLYNIMTRLEPVAPVTEMDQLENIYSRTRDISRENTAISTEKDYVDSLVGTLLSSSPNETKVIIRGQELLQKEKLSEEKKIVIYRVLQELMVNMKKHSKASLVAIIFSKEENFLKINYSDNGVGTGLAGKKSGNGLQNVENRIFSVNGHITFENGNGFKVEIRIPV